MKRRLITFGLLLVACVSLNSCWLALVGGGAAAGYMARDKGYKAQAPITKDE